MTSKTGGNKASLGSNPNWNSGWELNFTKSNDTSHGVETSMILPAREFFIPQDRPIEELFNEDFVSSKYYRNVAEEDENIAISGPNIGLFLAIDSWENINFDVRILENIRKSQYVRPRKIQSFCIPLILEGRDLKGHAETGSGKTAAFLLPIIQMILKKKESSTYTEGELGKAAPFAIIVEPTRELCAQLAEQGRKFSNGTGVIVSKSYGHFDAFASRQDLRTGCDILCATPGRLKHILYSRWIRFDNISFFVLDEADRLLEESFIDVVRDIVTLPEFPIKEKRQNLLFSATFPPLIQRLSSDVLKADNVMVSNKKLVATNSKVLQNFISVIKEDKKRALLDILKSDIEKAKSENAENPNLQQTLVFVQTKRDADLLSLWLSGEGIKSTTINGDRSQMQREQALSDFRKKKVHVLVSTDVCARGMDIKDLDHVINFDLPNDPIVYVHRIGRTGRIKSGFATSFFDDYNEVDRCLAADLVKFVIESGQEVPEFLQKIADDSDFHALPNPKVFDPYADPWADLPPPIHVPPLSL